MKPVFSAPIDTSAFSPSFAVFALMAWLNHECELIPRFSGRFNRKEEAEAALKAEGAVPSFYTWIDLGADGNLRLEANRARIESALQGIEIKVGRTFSEREIGMAIDAAYVFIETHFIAPWGALYLGSGR